MSIHSFANVVGIKPSFFEQKTIQYDSELHEELVFRLQDLELATKIHTAFIKHIAPRVSPSEKEQFSKALVKVAVLFGERRALEKALFEEGFGVERHADSLRAFLDETAPKFYSSSPSGTYKVAIITTSASGGNHSVAKAVAHWLNRQPASNAVIFDAEVPANSYDPYKIATGQYTYDGIYEAFFQKQGLGNGMLEPRDTLNRTLTKYVTPKTSQKLASQIGEYAPDLIITTRSYKQDDFSIGRKLGVPTRILYCDYGLCVFHKELIGKTNAQNCLFWLPSLSPDTFRTIIPQEHFDASDTWEQTAKKVAAATNSTFEEIRDSFIEIGYPVNEEFERITDSARLARLRQKWHVAEDESVVMISMGKNGVAYLEEIFDEFMRCPAHTTAFRYFFICGTNAPLQKRLQEKVQTKDLSQTALKQVHIHGLLSLQEKSELMNLTHLMLEKPGGATVAECRAMGVGMLCMHAHELWEGPNEEKMSKEGLLHKRNASLSLHLQVEQLVEKHKIAAPVPVIDWKLQLSKALRDR